MEMMFWGDIMLSDDFKRGFMAAELYSLIDELSTKYHLNMSPKDMNSIVLEAMTKLNYNLTKEETEEIMNWIQGEISRISKILSETAQSQTDNNKRNGWLFP